jgi:hypothetical protein
MENAMTDKSKGVISVSPTPMSDNFHYGAFGHAKGSYRASGFQKSAYRVSGFAKESYRTSGFQNRHDRVINYRTPA